MLEKIFQCLDSKYKIQNLKDYLNNIADKFVDKMKRESQPGTILHYLRSFKLYSAFLSCHDYADLSPSDQRRLDTKLKLHTKALGKENKARIIKKAEFDQGMFFYKKNSISSVLLLHFV